MAPLRCHLLIGPPASGKTTLARLLAPLLTAADQPEALILSTDRLRAELFGDAAVQGPWSDIQPLLHRRIVEAVAAGRPVIVDATHARRPWRLALTQALALPRPVEWIGWWLHTPLAVCLEWNIRRERRVPEAVIREMAAALADPDFGPCRAEGFAALCALVPPYYDALSPLLQSELAGLDRRIRAARNRERQIQRHGHSRLLDLERLLFLLRLLSSFPMLEARDPGSRQDLEALLSPLPQGDLAERAAAFLRRLHGECYADVAAIRADLNWLQENGFAAGDAAAAPIRPAPLAPGPDPLRPSRRPGPGGVHGGLPPLGDAAAFLRVMTLLRHLLHHPFDHPAEAGVSLHQHLIAAIEAVPGGYLPGETATLRKDLEKILTPYGFRSGRGSSRHGLCLGTALLSLPRLREVHAVVQQAAGRLGDPSAQDLVQELEQRLSWADIAWDREPPVRSYAQHAVVDRLRVRRESLAAARGAEAIEQAIFEHRRVTLRRFAGVGSFPGSPSGELRGWPLQLVFHAVGWYLLLEDDGVGRAEGLIRSERLDRLTLVRSETSLRRSDPVHGRAVQRAQRLMHHCGGIYFGEELEAQLAVASSSARARATQLQTLRFSCTAWAFAFLREGLNRYPLEQTRFSRPLPGDDWWHHPQAPHVLEPNRAEDSHPYPLELDLPRWTLERDVDLRRWLFGFGEGVRIEAPQALRQELLQRSHAVLAVHGAALDSAAADSAAADSAAADGAAPAAQEPPRAFPNRWRRG